LFSEEVKEFELFAISSTYVVNNTEV